MLDFLTSSSLYLLSALALAVLLFLAQRWSSMPVLQRFTALMLIAVVAHIWKRRACPGASAI